MKNKKTNVPNVWNKAKTNNISEGSMWINPDEPEKVKIFKNGKWEKTNPFEDLEQRKVKK